ncbi:unnamed protein product [Fraxinus pennsylvanica]|uniref:Uncharacterized protein n=1 Tax=Fraxinus pennsylvanica TaxID=56036 RepID=A0AAD1YP49_9LAMI|nr:unnamed protein product [Fraxinus pennsylvanica]
MNSVAVTISRGCFEYGLETSYINDCFAKIGQCMHLVYTGPFMFVREKQNIQKLFEGMPGRICLSLDLWSSCQTTGYMFVTGQFIDSDWKMHCKLLNVIMEPYPDSATAFSHSVAARLFDCSMDGRLFSVAINQPLNDAAVDNLRAILSVKNLLVLNGQLLVGNCVARSLSSVVQDALTSVQEIVNKVRDSVKYVKTSDSREESFLS